MTITSGVVKEVKDNSIDVEREGLPDILDVRFNSVLSSVKNEFRIVPKVGSMVLCGLIENDITEAVLLQCGEIEKVHLTIEKTKAVYSAQGVKIERENENLKKVFNDMIELLNEIVVVQGNTLNIAEMKKVQQRLNKILV